jgi:predicted O-methyltransferase YrrM
MGIICPMESVLRSQDVVGVLDRLRSHAQRTDEQAKRRVSDREAQLGTRVYGQERAALYGDASLAITTEVGELLYVLAITRQERRIVEFGASLGFSTIFLAAAIRDGGHGSLISTEMRPEKAEVALRNLADAGLEDLLELRVGDALQTLANVTESIDMLFLDGWNNLYTAVLELMEPHLAKNALVVADLSEGDTEQLGYQQYVRDPGNGYMSVTLPLDAGVEVSVRL